jgi:ubiquinone/menaquinone biosynthesis C-methylase UbiE
MKLIGIIIDQYLLFTTNTHERITLKNGFLFSTFEQFLIKRRAQVLSLFLEIMKPGSGDSCLEIGGPTFTMSEITTRFHEYFVINMDENYLKMNSTLYKEEYYPFVADGCKLPLRDKSVDYIFGNAVLEHVPRRQRQEFAKEVKRVCRKGYFLANDNHWFPYDPHYLVPFYQFLPHKLKRFISCYVSFKWIPKGNYDPVDLLTMKEYRKLFPDAKYKGLRFPLSPVAESILVWHIKE